MVGASRTILSLSLSSSLFTFSKIPHVFPFLRLHKPRFHHAFRPLYSAAATTSSPTTETNVTDPDQLKHTILLERLRLRHLKESAKPPQQRPSSVVGVEEESSIRKKSKKLVENFQELGLSERNGGGYGSTLPPIPKPSPWRTAPTPSPHHRRGPRLPPPSRETNAMTWSAAFCCAIFWVILILGGLIILIVYLVYRPRSPYVDISAANLNAAYLDMGFLLNGDLTILANVTNPSKKSSVEFSYVTFELYYYNTLIATQYIEPFKVPKKTSMFANVHLVSSQVQLQATQSRELQRQIETGPVLLNLRGMFHARSHIGPLFRYSYKLHTHCSVSLNGPPLGAMRARRCNTKR